MSGISIVIPTLNEAGNIPGLLRRIGRAFDGTGIEYEIIFIDDHSTDGTMDVIKRLSAEYPNVVCFLKEGKRGKAQSLIQGFAWAQFDRIGFIDADLQYPPEAIPKMFDLLDHGYDIVVADRVQHDEGFLRTVTSRGFSFFFSRFLHGLSCDVQSGLKVFKRRIAHEVRIEHPSPWTFDLEFLLAARNYGYVIGSVPIRLEPRRSGESKIKFLRAVYEIGWNALRLRFTERPPLLITPENEEGSMVGAGIAHGSTRFVTHTTLHHDLSALRTFAPWQRTLIQVALLIILSGLFLNPLLTGISVLAVLTAVYFLDSVFQLFLVLRSLKTPPEIGSTPRELLALDGERLPSYSILCPLYREANMLPTFVEAMNRLDWPKDRLDIMLLLEENDQETIDAARAMKLPDSFRILVVPHSLPKTKPKACNFGLNFAKGEYVVIYDAEDIPDPAQLKKAYLGFRKAGPSVRCLQAKLNYFNPHQNLLTRFFTAEYSLWFDVVLPGLQSINTSIPLGGTSNHFRTRDLLELEGWDPFNVTEDCDLGVRIFKRGFKTAIIDSVTLEEANSNLGNWIRQRSRWIKGYMQTYLVHMRDPIAFFRENGLHALVFQLVVGMKIGFMFINPILWIATVSYFTLYAVVGPTIQALFPPVVFYLASFSLVFGNFLYLYYYMIGAAKREHYSVVKYVFLIPLYWIMLSYAASIALYQLIVKPHYWEKTVHGLHTKAAKKRSRLTQLSESMAVGRVWFPKWKLTAPWAKWLLSQEGIFIYALSVSSVLNFVFNAYLGRVLSYEEYGFVALVNTVWYFAMIAIGAFATSINHRSAYLLGRGDRAGTRYFFFANLKKGVRISVLAALAWFLLSPFISSFFHVDGTIVLALFSPAFILGVVSAGSAGFLQGSFRFLRASVVVIAEAVSKLALAAIFVSFGLGSWAYLSIPLSIAVSAAVAFAFLHGVVPEETAKSGRPTFPNRFFAATVLSNVSSTIFLSLDMLLVKHYLDPHEAGEYALLSLAGKMIFFFGSLSSSFLLTYVSRNEGRSISSRRILAYTFGITIALVTLGVLAFGAFGPVTLSILLGDKARAVNDLYLPYTAALGVFTVTNVIVIYGLARKRYVFPFVSLLVSLFMAFGIALFHGSISQIVEVILFSSLTGGALSTVAFLSEPQHGLIGRAFRDFAGAFIEKLPVTRRKRIAGSILVFNWRDMRHDFAGGAEVYIEELARQWARQGNRVTLFCGNDGRSPRSEIVEGVEIVRRGGFYLVYFWAFFYYLVRFRGRYDIVVDCHNGIPFFSPLYVRKPKVFCLMHHVHQEVFRHSLPGPLSSFARFLEKDMMPIVYRKVRFITVSESSKREMEDLGLGCAGIQVIHPGIHLGDFAPGTKSDSPVVLYLGRLKAYKSVDVLIRAFRAVLEERPEAKLVIAGSGEEERYLKRLARDLRLSDDQVSFLGKVTEAQKRELLRSSWVVVNPSFMEGWGIVVIEANACGTPVIASDIPGLRDSVRDASTGYLVKYGDSDAFATKILSVIRDAELRDRLGRNAREWAKGFDWMSSGEAFFATLISIDKH
ncbi:MAG TPA: glycosyltransferase [Candidatus Fimivivens sp.]|nr:glycosyltransferase [Candidatus Fimivivens sp.]